MLITFYMLLVGREIGPRSPVPVSGLLVWLLLVILLYAPSIVDSNEDSNTFLIQFCLSLIEMGEPLAVIPLAYIHCTMLLLSSE